MIKRNFKGFVSGILFTLLLSILVCADPVEKNLLAFFDNIMLFVDGVQVNPTDANQNTVQPFIVDGTTYLPVRAVAQAIGKEVTWDGENKSIYIGQKPLDRMESVQVGMELENGDKIVMSLYPEIAPLSVQHFLENINSKYYDGKVFHRAVEGFMIQGGSKDGNGIGGSDKTIKGEFSANGINNTLKHTRGVISLARAWDPDSASGQFFIMHADAPHLDGNYAAFGKVIKGMDVVDKIATSAVNGEDLVNKPVIKSMYVIED